MDDLIDLSTADASKYLDRAEWKGWIRSKRVLTAPPGSYLLGDERPSYVLHNDEGLRLEHDGLAERHEPADGYRALALITDVRILFLVGGTDDDGDEVIPVPFSDVEWVSEDGADDELTVRTPTETVTFPSPAGLDTVVEEIHERVDDYDEVNYLLSQVETGIRDAREALAPNRPDLAEASDAIGFGVDHLERADRAVSDISPGAVSAFEQQLDHYREVIRSLRADLTHGRADDYRRRARTARLHDDYETALKYLKTARRRYGTLGADAVASFTATSDAIDALRREPLSRAQRARVIARRAPDPTRAVAHWETALARYRTVLTLDWGTDATRFDLDRETVRDRLAETVERLLVARARAADRWVALGDVRVGRDSHRSAAAAYDRAAGSLTRAIGLARQHDPDCVGPLDEQRSLVECRLDRLGIDDIDHTETTVGVPMEGPTDERPDVPEGDADDLCRFVAAVWASRGWETSVFRTAAGGYADVLATVDGPPARDAYLWVHHESETDREEVLGAIETADTDPDPDADWLLVTTDCVDERVLTTEGGRELLVVDRRRLRALETFFDSEVCPRT